MKLEIIDSLKGTCFFVDQDVVCLNLNSFFKKGYDLTLLKTISNKLTNVTSLNLCNFSSLYFRLGINQEEILSLLYNIVDTIKNTIPNVQIVQQGILNFGEKDIEPFSEVITIKNSIIQIIKPLKDVFTELGFTDCQITQLIQKYDKNVINYLPKDMISKLPIYKNMDENFLIKLRKALN